MYWWWWASKETKAVKCPNVCVPVCVCIQRKPRVVPNPVPTSPTSSTPEPDTSTVPLDNATIPNSALQAPTGTQPPQTWTYCTLLYTSLGCVVHEVMTAHALPPQQNLTNMSLQLHFDGSHSSTLPPLLVVLPPSLCLPKQVRQGGAPFGPTAYPAAPGPLWARPGLFGASAVRSGLRGLCPQPGHSLLLPQVWTRRRSHFRWEFVYCFCGYCGIIASLFNIVLLSKDLGRSKNSFISEHVNSEQNLILCPSHLFVFSSLLWPAAAHPDPAHGQQCHLRPPLPGKTLPQPSLRPAVWQPACSQRRPALRQSHIHCRSVQLFTRYVLYNIIILFTI